MKHQTFLDLPFLGRKQELALFSDRFNQACAYQGNSMLVIGEPGMGKTRLVEEFLSQHTTGCQCLNNRVTQSTSHAVDLFVTVLRSYLVQSGYAARTITRVIDRSMYDTLAGLIPELKAFYPYEPKKVKQPISVALIREYFYRFILNLGRFAPVIMIIEDLHLSSPELRTMFKHLIQNIKQQPIMCVFTSRPDKEVATWFRKIQMRQRDILTLQGLQKEDIIELSQELFDSSIEDAFFEWLSEKTKGVPLFLREFLHALIEKGIILYDNESEQWQIIESYKDIAVPEAVSDFIQTKLDTLSSDEIKYLHNAAIIGEEFDPSIPFLQDKGKLIPYLIRKGLIIQTTVMCKFAHPLIWETVYNHVSEHERCKLHRKLGDYYRRSGDKIRAIDQYLHARIKTKWLVNMLFKTSMQLKKNHRCALCLDYFSKAFELTRALKDISGKTILDILINYIECIGCMAQSEKAGELSYVALRLFRKNYNVLKDREKMQAYKILAMAFFQIGKHNYAIRYANKGITLAKKFRTKKAKSIITYLMYTKISVYTTQWKFNKALSTALSFKGYFTTHGDYDTISRYYGLLGFVYSHLSDWENALSYYKEVLRLAIRKQDAGGIATAHANLGAAYVNTGEYKEAENSLLVLRRYLVDDPQPRLYIISCLELGKIYMKQGLFVQAENEFTNGLKKCDEAGMKSITVFFERSLSVDLICEERFENARTHIQEGTKLAQLYSMSRVIFNLLFNKGLLHFALKEKCELKKIIDEIYEKYKKQTEASAKFEILQGLYHISIGTIDKGLRYIDKGIGMFISENEYFSSVYISYFCSRRFRFMNVAESKIVEYTNKAIEIAKQHNMDGWLEILCPEKGPAPKQPLKISCLGSLMIEHPITGRVDLNQLQWAKPRQLFSVVLTSCLTGEKVDREKIAALLWPELSAKKVTNVFHVTLSSLKKVIGKEYLRYRNRAYELFDVEIDGIDFRRLIAEAEALLKSGKIHTAETALHKALELYRGDFLNDYYDTWLDRVRHELSGLYRTNLLLLGDILLQKVKFAEAEEIGKKLLHRDPFDEEGHRFLMRSYAAAGEKALALQQYERCFRIFTEQLKCPPSEQTQQLHHDIKR
jgi:DNA-binding SARP family transcriptional activator